MGCGVRAARRGQNGPGGPHGAGVTSLSSVSPAVRLVSPPRAGVTPFLVSPDVGLASPPHPRCHPPPCPRCHPPQGWCHPPQGQHHSGVTPLSLLSPGGDWRHPLIPGLAVGLASPPCPQCRALVPSLTRCGTGITPRPWRHPLDPSVIPCPQRHLVSPASPPCPHHPTATTTPLPVTRCGGEPGAPCHGGDSASPLSPGPGDTGAGGGGELHHQAGAGGGEATLHLGHREPAACPDHHPAAAGPAGRCPHVSPNVPRCPQTSLSPPHIPLSIRAPLQSGFGCWWWVAPLQARGGTGSAGVVPHG